MNLLGAFRSVRWHLPPAMTLWRQLIGTPLPSAVQPEKRITFPMKSIPVPGPSRSKTKIGPTIEL